MYPDAPPLAPLASSNYPPSPQRPAPSPSQTSRGHDHLGNTPAPVQVQVHDKAQVRQSSDQASTRATAAPIRDYDVDATLRPSQASKAQAYDPGATTASAGTRPRYDPEPYRPREAYRPSQRGPTASAQRGFYIPPPGYNVTPTSSKLEDGGARSRQDAAAQAQEASSGSSSCHSNPSAVDGGYWPSPPRDWQPQLQRIEARPGLATYGGHGEWHPIETSPGRWTWMPVIRTRSAGDSGLDAFFSSLSHNDWTVPQAKQMLTSWATVATLLAGTQGTLLTLYKSDLHPTSVGFGFAALFLEIWGAMTATICIVVSITLQGADEHGAGRRSASMHRRGANDVYSSPTAAAPKKRLSIKAACILDRLTLATGWIVPSGAILEVIGILAYVTAQHNGRLLYGLVTTMCLSAGVTVFAIGAGYYSGHCQQARLRGVGEVRRRPMSDRHQADTGADRRYRGRGRGKRGVDPDGGGDGRGDAPGSEKRARGGNDDAEEELDERGPGFCGLPLMGWRDHGEYGPDYADSDSDVDGGGDGLKLFDGGRGQGPGQGQLPSPLDAVVAC
ncbi:uncharacterized protein PFL1_05425 [Pseudozyma flocculosa PF-1]|uniref:Uncharacterized protein n=2 Tax=Pseudozyma flocculosa TaxID=84751 RepID=A0A5C3FCC3_9BASI|nr:uncharacterized protein PFL1_05425 [Pseudozyma flocculosa PF-1]EPQ27144.1 hypothetical protein PFL1_05425 [Pseudozyma flocculosa PF-1]SPO41277.1 uncharacterized protein PSFLO_06759 [Pseudozyma flocculosa]